MAIYIDNRRVADDWQLKSGQASVGDIRLYSGAALTLPEGVTSVGDIVLDSGAALTLPEGCKIKGHLIADPETAARRMKAVAEAATASQDALKMDEWHCGTSHCIAGWAVHLEGEAGYALEKEVGPASAGIILLGIDAAKLFFLKQDDARSALHRVLADQPALPA